MKAMQFSGLHTKLHDIVVDVVAAGGVTVVGLAVVDGVVDSSK